MELQKKHPYKFIFIQAFKILILDYLNEVASEYKTKADEIVAKIIEIEN